LIIAALVPRTAAIKHQSHRREVIARNRRKLTRN
jgi:hypothetical protein